MNITELLIELQKWLLSHNKKVNSRGKKNTFPKTASHLRPFEKLGPVKRVSSTVLSLDKKLDKMPSDSSRLVLCVAVVQQADEKGMCV